MKNSTKGIALIGFIAMAAFAGCKKNDVQPVKSTPYHANYRPVADKDSSGGEEPPIPPK
jgi:hypothetical protein